MQGSRAKFPASELALELTGVMVPRKHDLLALHEDT